MAIVTPAGPISLPDDSGGDSGIHAPALTNKEGAEASGSHGDGAEGCLNNKYGLVTKLWRA